MEELVAHGLRSLRECLPSEQALNTKVCLIIDLPYISTWCARMKFPLWQVMINHTGVGRFEDS